MNDPLDFTIEQLAQAKIDLAVVVKLRDITDCHIDTGSTDVIELTAHNLAATALLEITRTKLDELRASLGMANYNLEEFLGKLGEILDGNRRQSGTLGPIVELQ